MAIENQVITFAASFASAQTLIWMIITWYHTSSYLLHSYAEEMMLNGLTSATSACSICAQHFKILWSVLSKLKRHKDPLQTCSLQSLRDALPKVTLPLCWPLPSNL